MTINETVLEMHYHQAIMEEIRRRFGLGTGAFNFYKYSPQRECFVGFDQAYIQTDIDGETLFEELQTDAMKNGYNLSNFFIGFFLQFKVVRVMKRKHVCLSNGRTFAAPHYRAALSTRPSKTSKVSQHELLYLLKKMNPGVSVHYACPMLFNTLDLYRFPADLRRLRLADLASCPGAFEDGKPHHIFFDDENAKPVWCSEPVEGSGSTGEGLVSYWYESLMNGSLGRSQLKFLRRLQKPSPGLAFLFHGTGHWPCSPVHAFTLVRYRSYDKVRILHC